MKKIILPVIILFSFFAISSCSKGSSTAPIKKPDTTATTKTDSTAKYYITYKINGVAINVTEISAVRGATSNPRTITITGTAKGGANPKIKLYTEEPSFGFSDGTSAKCTMNSYPVDYVEYTNNAGTVYSTRYDTNGAYFDYITISYTNGGEITGIFDGSVSTSKGVAIPITDGKYTVKFSN